ncbi:lymphocyte antigen 6E-like [Pleurodeles waltl]|uniref:lymphocyte antigen 6E-like n=1 Tax=Pleurodeles waltl TaxID=8319 RepID=UPI003709591B
MKAAVGSLLLVAVLAGTGYSLRCFSCTTTSESCSAVVNCQQSEEFCVSNVTTSGNNRMVTKHCSTTCGCNNGATNQLLFHCCKEDFCNDSGASSVKTNYAMLSVAVGVSAFLLRAGL